MKTECFKIVEVMPIEDATVNQSIEYVAENLIYHPQFNCHYAAHYENNVDFENT